jgi:acetaldehyde dehydrogenase/alcohol dehydrogenase
MAIVDPQLVLNIPKKLTAWGGIDALTHALESYVSVFATDYTKVSWLLSGSRDCLPTG